jgi:hypothetical protein
MKSIKNVNPASYGDLQRVERAIKKQYEQTQKNLNVYILDKGEKRTLSQNSYYWSLMQIIADDIGDHKNEVHRFFKKKFLPTEEIKVGGFIENCEATTTDLSTKTMTDYIDNIIQFSLNFWNIHLPIPNEVPIEQYLEATNQ